MKISYFLILATFAIAACSTKPSLPPLPDTAVPYTAVVDQPPTVVAPVTVVETRREVVPLSVSPELLDPNACPSWPRGRQPTAQSQLSAYLYSAFQAYRCERLTRNQIRREQEAQRSTVTRNN